jgi:tRNA (cytidine/uridine-2'-O-)-methyltransferase
LVDVPPEPVPDLPDLHLALVWPEIPWNTGNAARSALAFGAQVHLVEPLGFSLDAREVKRAGLDYWEHVKPRVHRDLDAFPRAARRRGVVPDGRRGNRSTTPLAKPAVFVLGCERGFPEALRRERRDRCLRIPQERAVVRCSTRARLRRSRSGVPATLPGRLTRAASAPRPVAEKRPRSLAVRGSKSVLESVSNESLRSTLLALQDAPWIGSPSASPASPSRSSSHSLSCSS